MSEEAAQIAREAKGLQQGLKDSLKSKDPWDKDVEFQRKNLRRQYLRLLFVYPYAAESRDVDTHLWMSTSYQFISKYKERIANLDRAINRHQQQQHQQQGSSRQQSGQQRVVEHRKLLQRFSQFLAEEHRFWRQLVVRIHRVFMLEDASRALDALHIDTDDAPAPADGAAPRRNQHLFPQEADVASPEAASSTPGERQTMIAVMSKALVCLGDIERYKELYNEKGGRPRAGHEEGPSAAPARGGRGRRGGGAAPAPVPRMRNYEKAQHCYEEARRLLPSDGNPSHQLAILATYQKDTFGSLVQYYRSLCVRNRYEPASENMDTTLARAWEQWKAKEVRRSREAETDGAAETGPIAPRLRVEALKEKVIVMHAMWRVSTEDTTPSLEAHSRKIADSFNELVSERILPLDMIWKVVILAQGALWRHRSTRHPTRNLTHGNKLASAIAIESHIATHIIALHRALLEVGIMQVAEASQEDGGKQDLAQCITAVFRRALPALRLASKWLRANFKYILEQSRTDPAGRAEANGSAEALGSGDRRMDKRQESRRRSNIPNVTISGTQEFWHAYVEFATALLRTFPVESLPTLSVPLEEDVETTGFLPLKRAATAEAGSTGAHVSSPGGAQGAHPNAEFLMRIQELLLDAQALAQEENSPILVVDDHFVVRGSIAVSTVRPVSSDLPNASRVIGPIGDPSHAVGGVLDQVEQADHDDDDDTRTEITRTDDDPVTLAFREVLKTDSEDDEEEDRIVYPRTDYPDVAAVNPALGTPHMYATPRNAPLSSPPPLSPRLPRPKSPLVPISSPRGMAPISPPRGMAPISPPRGIAPISPPRHAPSNGNALPPLAVTKFQGTTAQDLLMGLRRSSAHSRTPSAPQPQLLFGSGNATSIWSTERDRNPLGYRDTPVTTTTAFPSYPQPSQPSLPSTLSPDRPQRQYVDNPALPFPAQQQPYSPFRGHQRISSLNLGLSQGLPSHGSGPHYTVSGGYAPLAEAPSALYQTGLPSAYVDPTLSAANPLLRHPYSPMTQVSSSQRMLDTRVGRPPPVLPPSWSGGSQIWSNHG